MHQENRDAPPNLKNGGAPWMAGSSSRTSLSHTGNRPKSRTVHGSHQKEYKQLYEATRARALEPKKQGFKWEAEQLHDYVLFAVNTGLRPDEAWRLQFRDVTIAFDDN